MCRQCLLEESVSIPSAENQAIAEAAKEANMVVSIGVNERIAYPKVNGSRTTVDEERTVKVL
jgi:hypothetical protein